MKTFGQLVNHCVRTIRARFIENEPELPVFDFIGSRGVVVFYDCNTRSAVILARFTTPNSFP